MYIGFSCIKSGQFELSLSSISCVVPVFKAQQMPQGQYRLFIHNIWMWHG